MAKIQLVVGSVGGRALQVAEASAAVLTRLGHLCRLSAEPAPQDLNADPDEWLLFVSSTTGDGELPRNLLGVYLALEDRRLNLRGRRYGVLALGDSSYPRFAHAGVLLDSALYGSGARMIGTIGTLDARTTANHAAAGAHWAVNWTRQGEASHV